ncbi:MAG: PD-(D/E)XK nuclease family protein [Bacillota bacterium]
MEINYIDFNSNLVEKAVTAESSIYIADNERTTNLGSAQKEYEKKRKPLTEQSRFFSWNDFKEIIFPVDAIILREEKLSVVLYEILTETEKEKLEINNYNDIIDFSARFHNFYRELNEYQVTELPQMEGWQKNRYELLKNIRRRYLNYLEEKGFTDISQVRKEVNFSTENVKKYDRLVLLNTVYFTPLEKKILFRLDKYIDIEIFLQLSPEDFSEENLNFKGLSLPDYWPGELNLYTAEEDMLQLASALALAEPEKGLLLSPRLENTEYHRIIPAAKVEIPGEEKFSRSIIFKFIRSLYRLLQSAPAGKDLIGLVELQNAVNRTFFRKYFNLSQNTCNHLKNLIQDNYLYLNQEMVNKIIPEVKPVFAELNNLRDISNLSDLVTYMDGLDLEKLSDSLWKNDLSQFYDGLMELSALEDMNLVSSWEKYYSSPAVGLLDRLLQYLEYKQIQPVQPEEKPELQMQSLESAPHCCRDQVVVFNARQGWLPAGSEPGFFLTEVQRREIGLPTSREIRENQRYYFLRHLLSARKAEVISLENKEENESPGAFMEELKLKYDLEFKQAPIRRSHYVNLYQGIFNRKNSYNDHKSVSLLPEPEYEIIGEEDPLIEKEDFPGDIFYLSYYKFNTLTNCYFQFFCERLMKLEEELGDVEKKLEPLTFGNIVHNLAEKMLNSVSIDQLVMEKKEIESLIEEILEEFSPKIDHRFDYYYKRVVKEELVASMQEFLEELKGILSYHQIKPAAFKVEYTPDIDSKPFYTSDIVDYYLRGRIDLFIRGKEGSLLVDFKSGGSSEDQLNFYSLLLNRVQDRAEPVYKYIYQVLEKDFVSVPPDSEVKFKEKMKKELDKFTESDKFKKITSNRCDRCSYRQICRVVRN